MENGRVRPFYEAADTPVVLESCSVSDLLLSLKEHEA